MGVLVFCKKSVKTVSGFFLPGEPTYETAFWRSHKKLHSTQVGGRFRVVKSACLALCLLINPALMPVMAWAAPEVSKKFDFELPSQNVADAIRHLSYQTKYSVLYKTEQLGDKKTNAISGRYSLQDALNVILEGTDLDVGLTKSRVIVVSLKKEQDQLSREQHMKPQLKTNKTILASIFAFLFSTSSGAQDADTASPDNADKKQSTLEVITVTSEKRVQNLQEVPIAISAFSSDMLDARGIATPQDLQSVVPGLEIGEQLQGPAKVTMRGIGSESIFPGGDPGVPMHINGHYTQSTAYVMQDMLDVERVEVLRGPQGTLYGRNAIGGNVNIITKRPSEYFEGSVALTLGNYNKRNLQAVINGALTDSVNGRIAISTDKRDGYVENIGIPGDDRDNSDYTSVRGSLVFNVTDDLEIYLQVYHFDDDSNSGQRLFTEYPTGPVSGGPNYYELNNAGSNPTLDDPFKVSNNTPSEQTNKSQGVYFDISWDLGDVEFRSLTAYSDDKWEVYADSDASAVVNNELHYFMPFKTTTQEFQLVSHTDSKLNWVAGLFYYDEESSYTYQILNDQATNDVNGDGTVDQNDPRSFISGALFVNAKSVGAYGQMDYQFTDKLTLIAGLRYTADEKQVNEPGFAFGIEGQPLPDPGFAVLGKRSDDWSETSLKLGVNYDLGDDTMLYLTYSDSFKSGGFNITQEVTYNPETVDAWEAGMKGEWLDGSVRVNSSLFYYDYQDKQDFQRYTALDGRQLYQILNASAATIKGVEIEAQAYLTDDLIADLSVGYLSAEFDDFNTIDIFGPNPTEVLDLSGNQLPYSPEWSIHLGLEQLWELSSGAYLTARLDYSWTDERYGNALNRDASSGLQGNADYMESYYLVNARLSWENSDGNWRAELYAQNLTDEVVQTGPLVGNAQLTYGTYLAPRTYGVKVKYSF